MIGSCDFQVMWMGGLFHLHFTGDNRAVSVTVIPIGAALGDVIAQA
jgi:hypothetical protein